MKHKYLFIALSVVLVFALCAGYVSLALRQQASVNVVVSALQGMKSSFLDKMEAKIVPQEKQSVVSEKTCRYINDGYGFSVMKPWTLLSARFGEEIDISKSLTKAMMANEMTRGIAATTVGGSNTVYFSTHTQDRAAFNRLYSFDLNTHKLTKIFEQADPDQIVWNVRGFDDTKLVILKESIDNTPGPCAPRWGSDGYFAFDVAAPTQGMAAYQVSQCLIDLAESESEACAKAI